MNTPVGPSDKPFQVWTLSGAFHSAWDSRSTADNKVAAANKEADTLGINTRYEVREPDDAS